MWSAQIIRLDHYRIRTFRSVSSLFFVFDLYDSRTSSAGRSVSSVVHHHPLGKKENGWMEGKWRGSTSPGVRVTVTPSSPYIVLFPATVHGTQHPFQAFFALSLSCDCGVFTLYNNWNLRSRRMKDESNPGNTTRKKVPGPFYQLTRGFCPFLF